ncbi:hypothetical protein VTJ04DRAFT_4449 [Mycothermus thermophilus]|uniref:uncharacterized protein n=1 Tax=Humicola insolens TaxID=85995 RepID=UPI0037427549
MSTPWGDSDVGCSVTSAPGSGKLARRFSFVGLFFSFGSKTVLRFGRIICRIICPSYTRDRQACGRLGGRKAIDSQDEWDQERVY